MTFDISLITVKKAKMAIDAFLAVAENEYEVTVQPIAIPDGDDEVSGVRVRLSLEAIDLMYGATIAKDVDLLLRCLYRAQ